MSGTLFVTVSGRVVDILAPKVADIDFCDIAEQLAKEARYNGGTPGVFYSVAQHSVVGTNWLISQPELAHAAPWFLTHDGPEYVLRDETTPKKRALDAVAAEFGAAQGAVREAFARLTERWDNVIHSAAGLRWPPPKDVEEIVHLTDKRLLLTEWAALHGKHPLIGDYSGVEPLPVAIKAWSWKFSQAMFEEFCKRLLPAFERPAETWPCGLNAKEELMRAGGGET